MLIDDHLIYVVKNMIEDLGPGPTPEDPNEDWDPYLVLFKDETFKLAVLPPELLANGEAKNLLRSLIVKMIEQQKPDVVAYWSSAWVRTRKYEEHEKMPKDEEMPEALPAIETIPITGEIVVLWLVDRQLNRRCMHADIIRQESKISLGEWEEYHDPTIDLFADALTIGMERANRTRPS